MRRLKTWWNNISVAKRLYTVVGVMAMLIATELFILSFAMKTLSAVRAFVGAESIWSKAQKNAALEFGRYKNTHDEKHYKKFLASFAIPDADHRARMELEKKNPDYEVIKAAFIEARIHPDDIEPVVHLFRRFYWISYLSKAIDTWRQGDVLLDQFKKAGIEYHSLVLAGAKNKKKMEELKESVHHLDDELTVLEENFSTVLGEGSRWLEKVVNSLLFLVVLLVESIGLTLTLLTTRYISRSLTELNEVTRRFSQGDFKSTVKVHTKDEIGILGESVNHMGKMLDESYQNLENKIQLRTAELNQTLEENKRLYQESINALAMRDQFISIASHELKTPLTTLQLQLYLLNSMIKKPTPDSDPVKFSDACLTQTQRMGTLISELMDLTQIKSGKLELHLENSNLSEIISDQVSTMMDLAAKRGASITVNASTTISGVFDPNRIRQVITNLVSNAIKYGGAKPIEITITEKDGNGIVTVKDHGPGIPHEKLDLIFQRFERANDDSTITGLGLGLFISKEIISQHRGTITVNSELGKGATFIVSIPLA